MPKVALSPKGLGPFTCRGPSRGYGRARSHDPTVVSTSPPGVISQAGGAVRRPTRPPGRKHPPQPGDVWVPSPPPLPSGLEGAQCPFTQSFIRRARASLPLACAWQVVGVCAAQRCVWCAAACRAGAFAACARACRAVSPRCRGASWSCGCAAVCGSLWSVVPLMVQCGAMCGL